MKRGTSLAELVEELERQQVTKHDYVADTRTMRVATEGGGSRLDIDGIPGSFGMTELAHSQVATHLSIPKVYYDRMRGEYPDLFDYSVNYLLPETAEPRLVRTL